MVSTFRSGFFWRKAALVGGALPLLVGLWGCDPERIGAEHIPEAEGRLKALEANKEAGSAEPGETAKASDEAVSLDMPLYPDAKTVETPVGKLESHGNGISMVVQETQDSLDKVVAYYQKAYPKPTGKTKPAGGVDITWSEEKEGEKRIVKLSVTDANAGNGIKTVQLSEVGGKTRIELMHVRPDKTADQIFSPPVPTNQVPPSANNLPAAMPETVVPLKVPPGTP